MQHMTPQAKIGILVILGMSDLLPDIAFAATQRAERAVELGNDPAAVDWFVLADAADDAMLAADGHLVERV